MQLKKAQMISEVDFPSVEFIAEQFLLPRSIRYNLFHSDTRNVLEIQIVQEIWMSKEVSSETLEDDLLLVPYLINRPDCIKSDGRGFSLFHKWNWYK